MQKRLIVCDYDNPKGYTFPSFGFGSSEKRIWHFAKTASELSGYEVIITGPLWLPKHVPLAKHFPKRLDASSYGEFIKTFGRCDYLFAGHEYFDKDEWTEPFVACADTLLSYQLHPYAYAKPSFNGRDRILFCYSDEMIETYKDQNPRKALLFHSGVDEEPFFTAIPEHYLLWIGRLDADKAPHYAIEAARALGIRLVILGKSVYQPEYYEARKAMFSLPGIDARGVLFGKEKMDCISKALCAIYTIAPGYSEAGAGVLGEILSSGVPIAGMSWTANDAVCEAVDSLELGYVFLAAGKSEAEIVSGLSRAIEQCMHLDRAAVHATGSTKYSPHRLVRELLETADALRTG